ncbi:hypothetical protein [Serratia sp. D1N4]
MSEIEINNYLQYLKDVFSILARKKIKNKGLIEKGLDNVVQDIEWLFQKYSKNNSINEEFEQGVMELLNAITAYRQVLGNHYAIVSVFPANFDIAEVRQMEKDFIK